MEKLQTDLSVLSGATGETSSDLTGKTRASVTPEKLTPKKKKGKKSLAMSPPRKYPIPNKDKNLGLQIDKCLPSYVPTFSYGIKSLRNEENYDNTETTDTSRTDKDDTSHTNRADFIEKVKDIKTQWWWRIKRGYFATLRQ